MAKHARPEEIVAKLRQGEVLISQGQSVAEAIRAIGVSEVTYGRIPQRRDLLHTSGGTGRDRKLALSRQHHQTARLAGLPTSSSRGVRASLRRLADPVSQVPNGGHSHRTLGLVEVEGFVAEWGVIQALQGVWHGPLCSDGRSMGEDGAALPGQARRSGPDRDGWAAVSGGGAVDCPHEQPLA